LKCIISRSPAFTARRSNNFYISLIQAIINQQLSVKAGESIYKKFSGHFGSNVKPELVAETSALTLRSLGLSNAKCIYVKDLSEKILANQLSLKTLSRKTDEEVILELTKVKGIGVWTAHMFLIFSLGRLDVLPVGDLGIKNAIRKNYRLKKLPDEKKITSLSTKNNWKPYQSIASWYLWMSLEL